MKIQFTGNAKKQLRRINEPDKSRICAGITALPKGDVIRLVNTKNSFRLRVGNWRVLFSRESGNVINVTSIAPRGQVYKEA